MSNEAPKQQAGEAVEAYKARLAKWQAEQPDTAALEEEIAKDQAELDSIQAGTDGLAETFLPPQ
jgi:hypothetical protein